MTHKPRCSVPIETGLTYCKSISTFNSKQWVKPPFYKILQKYFFTKKANSNNSLLFSNSNFLRILSRCRSIVLTDLNSTSATSFRCFIPPTYLMTDCSVRVSFSNLLLIIFVYLSNSMNTSALDVASLKRLKEKGL